MLHGVLIMLAYLAGLAILGALIALWSRGAEPEPAKDEPHGDEPHLADEARRALNGGWGEDGITKITNEGD